MRRLINDAFSIADFNLNFVRSDFGAAYSYVVKIEASGAVSRRQLWIESDDVTDTGVSDYSSHFLKVELVVCGRVSG
jgi:hypothetical protein